MGDPGQREIAFEVVVDECELPARMEAYHRALPKKDPLVARPKIPANLTLGGGVV